MTKYKEIFLDKDLRCGGFYELAIQVCQSIDNNPIELFTDYIWSLKNVSGPFDENFNKIDANIENIQHRGLLTIDNIVIPFMTYNIHEDEPIESGFNWFDICFYTNAIEKLFGEEYQTWSENPKVPKSLMDFLSKTIKDLYKRYNFELAIIGFEVSGQYYFENLKQLVNTWEFTEFFIGENKLDLVAIQNKEFVKTLK